MTEPRDRKPWEYGYSASPEVRTILDDLDAQVEAAQDAASAENAETASTGATGRVNPSSAWDHLVPRSDATAWDNLAERSTEAEARRVAEEERNRLPEGWR